MSDKLRNDINEIARVHGMNIEKQIEKPAVFLDRDGVLTTEEGYTVSVADLVIFPYASKCITQIHKKGYYAIVITNQSGIARGLFTEADLLEMNQYLRKVTGVDAIYYCPHYEQGMVPLYSIKCNCRKPKVGLIKQACEDYAINLNNSYMVGDRASDILAGQRMGLRTVLLESGYGSKRLEISVTPDYIYSNLLEFVKKI